MENLRPELKSFIENHISKYKIKNVDLSDLNLNTSLDLDLNLFDLEMDLFLADFLESFDIDYSDFNWKKYGYPRGSFLILLFRSLFNYRRNWVKRMAHRLYKPKIHVRKLQEAMENGILQ